ncbi:MAG: hypothetical protein K2G24_06365 [Muribaculaceae bacterium]|nr:hypothetical protein [Muribaculaceae bacterium]
MKAIISNSTALRGNIPEIRLIADSAIGRQREPYWTDTDSDFKYAALICPCYRIGRLGKNIDRRFASRYIDALAPAALIIPETFADAPMETAEIFLASTNALIPGDDAAADFDNASPLTLSCNGETREFTPCEFIQEAVPTLSRFMTLKNGDRIIDCSNPIAAGVLPRSTLEACIGNITTLKIKML